jgi:hypothetical protein
LPFYVWYISIFGLLKNVSKLISIVF